MNAVLRALPLALASLALAPAAHAAGARGEVGTMVISANSADELRVVAENIL